MKLKTHTYIRILFAATLSLAFLIVFFLMYYIANESNFRPERVIAVHDFSYKVKDISEKGTKDLFALIQEDRIAETIPFINQLKENIDGLRHLTKNREANQVLSEIVQLQSQISSVMDKGSLKKSTYEFESKLNELLVFYSRNNWKTLSHLAEVSISTWNYSSPTRIQKMDIEKISRAVESMEKFRSQMEGVTTASGLDAAKKESILVKLQELSLAHGKITQILVEYRKLDSLVSSVETKYSKWIATASPEATLGKLNIERFTKEFWTIAIIALVVLAALFLASFMIFKHLEQKQSKESEDGLLDIIRQYVLADQDPIDIKGSQKFLAQMHDCRENFKKRTSFGQVLQNSLPFPALLLNSNLNLVWANNLFYQTWEIDEDKIHDESYTWNYLQQITNLGANDPVHEALLNDIGGIFHIQLKAPNDKESAPYEMFVTPVETNQGKRAMVLFYPLKGLEQNLTNLRDSLTAPVQATLEAFLHGEYNEFYAERSHKDFDVAGIDAIHASFELLDQKIRKKIDFLESENDQLNREIIEKEETLTRIATDTAQLESSLKDMAKRFRETRDHIVETVTIRSDIEEVAATSISVAKEISGSEQTLISNIEHLSQLVDESLKALRQLDEVKQVYKLVGESVFRVKQEFQRGLEQAIVLSRSSKDSKTESLLLTLREHLRNSNPAFETMVEKTKQLDSAITRLQGVIQSKREMNLDELIVTVDAGWSKLGAADQDLAELTKRGGRIDEVIIKGIKEMYDAHKLEDSQLRVIAEAVRPYRPKIERRYEEINH